MAVNVQDFIKALRRKPDPLTTFVPEDNPQITLDFCIWLHRNFNDLVNENETKLDSSF